MKKTLAIAALLAGLACPVQAANEITTGAGSSKVTLTATDFTAAYDDDGNTVITFTAAGAGVCSEPAPPRGWTKVLRKLGAVLVTSMGLKMLIGGLLLLRG